MKLIKKFISYDKNYKIISIIYKEILKDNKNKIKENNLKIVYKYDNNKLCNVNFYKYKNNVEYLYMYINIFYPNGLIREKYYLLNNDNNFKLILLKEKYYNNNILSYINIKTETKKIEIRNSYNENNQIITQDYYIS